MADNEHDDDLVDYDEEEVRERIVCSTSDVLTAGSSSTDQRLIFAHNSFFGFSNVSYIDRR